jgi:hypothetical protein
MDPGRHRAASARGFSAFGLPERAIVHQVVEQAALALVERHRVGEPAVVASLDTTTCWFQPGAPLGKLRTIRDRSVAR